MDFKEAFVTKGKEVNLSFSSQQVEQFNQYYELLVETNKVMNLTALTEPEDVAVKHMIDSLLVYDKARFAGKTVADVGTGAGFPGLALKIYDPSIRLTLIDALAKRLKFLATVITTLGLGQVELIHARAEDAGQNPKLREKFQVTVARAVANLPVLAEYCLPLTAVGGHFYALKGSKYQEETAAGKNAIKMLGGSLAWVEEVHLPGLDDARAIIAIKKVKNTPKQFPRKAGIASKKPL